MDEFDNIDKHLGHSLSGYEAAPRADSFEKVLLKMRRRKRRRLLLLLPLLGLLTAGALLVFPLSERQQVASESDENTIRETAALRKAEPAAADTHPITSRQTPQEKSPEKDIQAAAEKTKFRQTVRIEKAESNMAQDKDDDAEPLGIAKQNPSQFKLAADTAQKQADTADTLAVSRLNAVYTGLPPVTSQKQPILQDLVLQTDSQSGKPGCDWFFGLVYSPQFTRLHLRENPQAAQVYGDAAYKAAYLAHRRSENRFSYGYSATVKGGFNTRRVQASAALGYLRMQYNETPASLLSSGGGYTSTGAPSGGIQTAAFNTKSSDVETGPPVPGCRFSYLLASAELARRFTLKGMQLKAGGGVHAAYLVKANAFALASPDVYTYNDAAMFRRWQFAPFIKAGFVEDLGEHMQIEISPYAFYTLPDMLHPAVAVIRQNNAGFGLELSLLFFPGRRSLR